MRISDWSSDVCSSDLVTKVQDRRLVRRTTTGQLGELAHRKTVVQRLFHRWVAQVEPLLHEVNPQHRLNGIRLATHLAFRSEEHTSELQSLMRISYAVFCLKKKKNKLTKNTSKITTI